MGNSPGIDYIALLPLIIVFGGAVLGVAVEAFLTRRGRFLAQEVLAVLTLAGAIAATAIIWFTHDTGVAGVYALMLDGPTFVVWSIVLLFSLLAVALFGDRVRGDSSFTSMGYAVPGSQLEREANREHFEHTEIFPLMLFSVFGMMLFPAANDLIMMFVALEVLSLPLYLLTGLARRRRMVSQEAALKYFLLGAVASAIFLYGIALTFGYANSFIFGEIDTAILINRQSFNLILAGMGLITVGVLFKVGAVPFHSWIPDVYTGAPTPVTAFMAIGTKAAAMVGLLRVLYVAFGSMLWNWQLEVAVIAVLTMTVGAVVGLVQRDVKRMLAYSSIAHVGFILLGVIGAVTTGFGSVAAVNFYLIAYGAATVGAFAIVMMVRRSGGEATNMEAWQGLGRSHPVLGVFMALFLLSMTGIPLTAGFLGKLFVFTAAWQGGFQWLVPVAIAFSVVTAAFYLRLIWTMFFVDPNPDTEVASAGVGLILVLGVCILLTVGLGILPGTVTELLAEYSVFWR